METSLSSDYNQVGRLLVDHCDTSEKICILAPFTKLITSFRCQVEMAVGKEEGLDIGYELPRNSLIIGGVRASKPLIFSKKNTTQELPYNFDFGKGKVH